MTNALFHYTQSSEASLIESYWDCEEEVVHRMEGGMEEGL